MSDELGPGHLFVLQGDLTAMALDDVIVPCDSNLNITRGFASLLGPTVPSKRGWLRPAGVGIPKDFTGPNRKPLLLKDSTEPRVWMLNSALEGRIDSPESDLDWLLGGVRKALSEIRAYPAMPKYGRARRTIGVPLVGVGEGGFAGKRARVIEEILRELMRAAREPGSPDIALVTWHRSDYAVIQSRRPAPPPPSSVPLVEVERLAKLAKSGDLVAFVGAGVGQSAGLPSWSNLLETLAARTPWDETMRRAVLDDLAPEDAAEVLGKELVSPTLQECIVQAVKGDRYGLSHGLLASMRLQESVTTNYDTLLELACDQTMHGQLRVLPRQRATATSPWLLKLHGDIEVPQSIVLTRTQYIDFDSKSVPLASVVQSHMVTRHMLFIGYSMSDGNFLRLAHQVRDLFKQFGDDQALVGTVITLNPKPAQSFLWDGNLAFLHVTDEDSDEGSRQSEILLDCIGHAACDEAPYLLDERYEELLTDPDKELLQALGKVRVTAHRHHRTAAWSQVHDLLAALGEGHRG